MKIDEFIERSNQTTTVGRLVDLYCKALNEYGYTKFCSFSRSQLQPDVKPSAKDNPHYNRQFLEAYEKYRYIEIDPVFKLFLRARGPFTWDEVRKLPLSKRQRAVMETRHDTGSVQGISMPVHHFGRHLVGMSLSSSHKDARTDKNAVSALYAISNQFHLARNHLIDVTPPTIPELHLSPREKEILIWCSQGKSNGVIAEIVGISEKTVEYHLNSLYRKLDVTNRTSAVLKAVSFGLIGV